MSSGCARSIFSLRGTSVLLFWLSSLLTLSILKLAHARIPTYLNLCGLGVAVVGALVSICGILFENASDEAQLLTPILEADVCVPEEVNGATIV